MMREDLVRVYEAGSEMEAQLLKDRLTAEGVQASVNYVTSPLDGLTAGEQTYDVYVLPADAERARQTVAAFEAERTAEPLEAAGEPPAVEG